MVSNPPYDCRFPRSLRSVVGSRYSETFWPYRGQFTLVRASVLEYEWFRITMILAKLFQKHSPARAFKLYVRENPWAPEAKMYDV